MACSGGSVLGTSSSLTLNNVTTDQAGTYTVIVSGVCGSVDQQRDFDGECAGDGDCGAGEPDDGGRPANVTFSVTATGTGFELSMAVRRFGAWNQQQPDVEQCDHRPGGDLHGDCQRSMRQCDQQRRL